MLYVDPGVNGDAHEVQEPVEKEIVFTFNGHRELLIAGSTCGWCYGDFRPCVRCTVSCRVDEQRPRQSLAGLGFNVIDIEWIGNGTNPSTLARSIQGQLPGIKSDPEIGGDPRDYEKENENETEFD